MNSFAPDTHETDGFTHAAAWAISQAWVIWRVGQLDEPGAGIAAGSGFGPMGGSSNGRAMWASGGAPDPRAV